MSAVSLCMIVKNEEKNIRPCLESVRDLVDEIVIVDTGSEDKTKEICEEFHAKLYDFNWNGNFSDARNFCMSKAVSDWILWMDADEIISSFDEKKLKEALEKRESCLYSVKISHSLETSGEDDKQYYISYHHRLFCNHRGFYFQGSIHEKLVHEDMNCFDRGTVCDFMTISHSGYQKDRVPDKALRNLSLLAKEKIRDKENPWLDYHLAAELYRLGDLNRAYIFINHAITMFLVQQKLPPALVYKLKYEIVLNSEDTDNALKGIEKALELYPDYVELHFCHGLLLYRREKFEEGLNSFRQCIILGEFNPNYLIRSGNGSFCAYYYMGRCYEELNQPKYAKDAYRQSLLSHPGFRPALDRMELLSEKFPQQEDK